LFCDFTTRQLKQTAIHLKQQVTGCGITLLKQPHPHFEMKTMKKLLFTIIAIVLASLFVSCEQIAKNNPLTTKSPEPAKTESNTKPEETAKHEKHEKHWDYEENGSNKWASLNPENKLCSEGKMQSPIDITNPTPAELTDISIKFPSAEFTMTHNEHVKDIDNNGHTIQVDFEEKGADTLKIGNANYKLWQFHFHSPSEHTINGKNAAMEMHIVHKDGNKLAVIGILIEQGAEDNKAFEPIWAKLPQQGKKEENIKLDINQFLPKSQTTYRYDGSLTVPKCGENVKWIVFTEPIQMSAAQIGKFKSLVKKNNRPTQPLNGRIVQTDRIEERDSN
jgi:carbonic anhydrase